MITYFKMKKFEWEMKAALYKAFSFIIDDKKDSIQLLQNLYTSLKDVPEDELLNEFIGKLAEIIHEENKMKCDSDIIKTDE